MSGSYWISNPNQFVDTELRTAYDAQPITLTARQHGQVATYVLDIKAVCGRARLMTEDTIPELTVSLLGNPTNETAHVRIEVAQGQSLQLQLVDAHGRLVEQRIIEQAGHGERQHFDLESNRLVSYYCIRP